MKFLLCGTVCTLAVFGQISLCRAETTLEKIARTGTLVIGTRTDSPPFAFINKNNEWVGFSIDLVEKMTLPMISKRLNKSVKRDRKESIQQTRIPLLTSNTVNLIADTMTDTQSRRENVDFSLTFFVTGAQFLVRAKGNPISFYPPSCRHSVDCRKTYCRAAGFDQRADSPRTRPQRKTFGISRPAGSVPSAGPGTGGGLHK